MHNPLTSSRGTRAASQGHALFPASVWEKVQGPKGKRGASQSPSEHCPGGIAPPTASSPFPKGMPVIRAQLRRQMGSTFAGLLRRLPESRGSSIALMPEVLRTPSFPLSCFPHPSLNPAPRLCPAVQAVRTEPRRPLAPQQFPRQDAQSSTAGKRDLSQGPEGGEGKEGAKAAGAGTREGVGAQLRSLGSRCRRRPDARQRAFPREP